MARCMGSFYEDYFLRNIFGHCDRIIADENADVYFEISVSFPNKEQLNDMCEAINKKVYRMRLSKCAREEFTLPEELTLPEQARPSAYIRSYTYVCYGGWYNEIGKAYLVIKCITDHVNNKYTFSMLMYGTKFEIRNLVFEIDRVFTKRILLVKDIVWDVRQLSVGDQYE